MFFSPCWIDPISTAAISDSNIKPCQSHGYAITVHDRSKWRTSFTCRPLLLPSFTFISCPTKSGTKTTPTSFSRTQQQHFLFSFWLLFFNLFFWYLFLIISNCFLIRSTQIKTYSWDNAQVVLAGNKCDMEEERVVSVDSGRLLAEQLGKSLTNIRPYVISVGWCFCDLLALVLAFVYGCNQQSFL